MPIKLTISEFIEKARVVHDNKYSYKKARYSGSKEKLLITCPLHGDFEQKPSSHLMGHGCGLCAPNGWFDQNKQAILYYLRINHNGNNFYKIGITNRTVAERFRPSELKKLKVVKLWNFQVGRDAYIREQEILVKYREDLAGVDGILKNGNTEIFHSDVLVLDG